MNKNVVNITFISNKTILISSIKFTANSHCRNVFLHFLKSSHFGVKRDISQFYLKRFHAKIVTHNLDCSLIISWTCVKILNKYTYKKNKIDPIHWQKYKRWAILDINFSCEVELLKFKKSRTEIEIEKDNPDFCEIGVCD